MVRMGLSIRTALTHRAAPVTVRVAAANLSPSLMLGSAFNIDERAKTKEWTRVGGCMPTLIVQ